MNKRKNQRKSGRKLNLRVCIMMGLVMYLSYALISQQTTLRASEQAISRLENEISEAENHLAQVESLRDETHSDAYIEMVAREKLGLVLQVDTVFVDVTGR